MCHAWSVARNQKEGDSIGIAHLTGAARRHDKIIRRRSVKHHRLATRQCPSAARLDSDTSDMCKIIAPRGLVGGKGKLQLARGDPRQYRLLDGLGSRIADQSAAQHHGAQVRLQQEPLPNLLHHRP